MTVYRLAPPGRDETRPTRQPPARRGYGDLDPV